MRGEAAERQADVPVPSSPGDGVATLASDLPADVAATCHALVDELAGMLKADGDPRPIGQLRTVGLADLLQRPRQTGSSVTAPLPVVAALAAVAAGSHRSEEHTAGPQSRPYLGC